MRIASLFPLRAGASVDHSPQTHVALRLVLYTGEVYRLPRSCPGIRIIDGEAWISFDATDTIACRGEEICLQPGRNFAVVATVGPSALVMEVLARGQRRNLPRISPPLRRAVRC